MKKIIKKLSITVSMIMIIMLISIGESKATLQANPNTHIKKTDVLLNWIPNVRNMEKTGESLGLSETLNDDLTASSESNGIDMHMMRSTEYGAIAILSASGYGNSQTLQESETKTTTGNKTGVYFTGTNWEYVAGGLEGTFGEIINPIYYDTYGDINTARIGDALGTGITTNPGCIGWHSATNASWLSDPRCPFFIRGAGGLFSFSYFGYYYGSNYYADIGSNSFAHGVASCGEGL